MHVLLICLIATVVSMAIGAFWFSPKIFGAEWMKLSNVDCNSKDGCCRKMCTQFLADFTTALTLYIVIMWAGATTPQNGASLGAIIGFGLVAMQNLSCAVWANKPTKLFLIGSIKQIITLMLTGAIIAHLAGL